MFGHKLRLDVNCSVKWSPLAQISHSWVAYLFLDVNFSLGVVPLTLGRVLKTQKHPRFSCGTFLFCMISFLHFCWKCTNHLFEHAPMFTCLLACLCVVCVWTQSLLTCKMLSLQVFNHTCNASKVKRGASVDIVVKF